MMSEATRVMIQISEMSDSITSIHMRRLRQWKTSPKWTRMTSPWPRAQRVRCAHSARSDGGTCMPTSARGSYTVCQPASSSRQVSSMSSVAIRGS